MNKGIFFRIFICIALGGFCLYSYLDLQNEITQLRISIPQLTSEVRRIEEENTHLLYKIEKFESPENLIHIAKQSEFAHLKFPVNQEVVTLRQSDALQSGKKTIAPELKTKPTFTFATTVKP